MESTLITPPTFQAKRPTMSTANFASASSGTGRKAAACPIAPTTGITGYVRDATAILKTASFGSRTTGVYNNYCARSAGKSPETAAVSPLKRLFPILK